MVSTGPVKLFQALLSAIKYKSSLVFYASLFIFINKMQKSKVVLPDRVDSESFPPNTSSPSSPLKLKTRLVKNSFSY
jgi:hypothetical protein